MSPSPSRCSTLRRAFLKTASSSRANCPGKFKLSSYCFASHVLLGDKTKTLLRSTRERKKHAKSLFGPKTPIKEPPSCEKSPSSCFCRSYPSHRCEGRLPKGKHRTPLGVWGLTYLHAFTVWLLPSNTTRRATAASLPATRSSSTGSNRVS